MVVVLMVVVVMAVMSYAQTWPRSASAAGTSVRPEALLADDLELLWFLMMVMHTHFHHNRPQARPFGPRHCWPWLTTSSCSLPRCGSLTPTPGLVRARSPH